jgi:micrococcal nuclease
MDYCHLLWGTLLSLLFATAAHADPCQAFPDRGPLPEYLRPGTQFAGPVVYVGDGDSVCIGVGPQPAGWVEVRLADFYAPELHSPGGEAAKATLVQLARGRRAVCVADHRSHDRIVARCLIGGRSLGDMMRTAGVREGGNGSAR